MTIPVATPQKFNQAAQMRDFSQADRQTARRPTNVADNLLKEVEAEEIRLEAEELAAGMTGDELQKEYLRAVANADDPRVEILTKAIRLQGEGKPNFSSLATLAMPLVRHTPPADPFPMEVFPTEMRNAAERMIEVIQAPSALVGQSLLAAVTLAAQPYINVMIDGRCSPVSNNFITVGESGERKSAVDRIANRDSRERQKRDHQQAIEGQIDLEAEQLAWEATRRKITCDKKLSHGEIKTELEALGARPSSSVVLRYTEEPSYEGLVRAYQEGSLSMGLFSDEGGRFFGGFAMNQENATKTITGLSKIWDGDPITRSRGGDGNIAIYGVRLSVHLMLQPVLSDKVFSDPLLSGQGFMSRCLCSFPGSTIGNRPYREANLSSDPMMSPYHARMQEIIGLPYPMGPAGMGLDPRNLTLQPGAKRTWIGFHNHIENLMKDGAPLRPVKGFAAKAAEHAARLAAVLAFFDDIEVQAIGSHQIAAGIALTEFYIGEALRLFNSATTNPSLLLAEKVLSWARHPERNGLISLTDLYQKGPSQLRTKAAALRIIDILVDHNQIYRVEGGYTVDGIYRRHVWRVAQ